MNLFQQELERRFKDTEFFRYRRLWAKTQRKLLLSPRDFLFLHGANGSGKTCVGSYWTAVGINSFDPLSGNFIKKPFNESFQVAAVGPSFDHVDQVMIPNLQKWVPEGSYHESKQKRMWWSKEKLGSSQKPSWILYWRSVDQGAKRIQGIELNRVWVDEEPQDENFWSELCARTFRRVGKTLVTMTAWDGTTWMHAWINGSDGTSIDNKLLVEMDVRENPYYYLCNCNHADFEHDNDNGPCLEGCVDCEKFDKSRGAEKLLRAMSNFTGVEFQIRVEGKYLSLAGQPVIDEEVRQRHIDREITPKVGYLDTQMEFHESQTGTADPTATNTWLRLITEPAPGAQYVIGADVGSGNAIGDWHAAVVLRLDTGDQVALIHTRDFEPRDFGLLLAIIGNWYNSALLIVEANNHGISTLDRLVDLQYGNIFHRQHLEDSVAKISNKRGFWCDKKSKPTAVNLMSHLLSRDDVKVYDGVIHGEMNSYTWLKKDLEGKFGIGCYSRKHHDDTMTALFLACWGMKVTGQLVDDVRRKVRQSENVGSKSFLDLVEQDLQYLNKMGEDREDTSIFELTPFDRQLYEDLGGFEDDDF
jgi:phage terminase large subunit-like protein